MKKRKKNSATSEASDATPPVEVPKYELPAGYEEKTSDLVGFWNPELGPLHFIPLHVKAFDSHIEPTKPSIIIVGHSVGQNKLVDEDGEPVTSEPGDMIGVWYKPGMIRLKDLANTKVFLYLTGEQDTGKPNPMKTFSVNAPKDVKSQTLYLQDDYRKKSLRVALAFEMKGARRQPVEDDDEDFGEGASRVRTRARGSNAASDSNGDIDF